MVHHSVCLSAHSLYLSIHLSSIYLSFLSIYLSITYLDELFSIHLSHACEQKRRCMSAVPRAVSASEALPCLGHSSPGLKPGHRLRGWVPSSAFLGGPKLSGSPRPSHSPQLGPGINTLAETHPRYHTLNPASRFSGWQVSEPKKLYVSTKMEKMKVFHLNPFCI